MTCGNLLCKALPATAVARGRVRTTTLWASPSLTTVAGLLRSTLAFALWMSYATNPSHANEHYEVSQHEKQQVQKELFPNLKSNLFVHIVVIRSMIQAASESSTEREREGSLVGRRYARYRTTQRVLTVGQETVFLILFTKTDV